MLTNCLLVTLTLLPLLNRCSGSLCTSGSDGINCTTIDNWRDNIVCRILGSTVTAADGTKTQNADGYILDATNITSDDNFSQAKTKMRVTRFYVSSINLLQRYYPNYSETRKNRLVESIEKQMVTYNTLLYGPGSLDNSQCALVDSSGSVLSTSRAVTCADKKDNPPNCGASTTTIRVLNRFVPGWSDPLTGYDDVSISSDVNPSSGRYRVKDPKPL